MGVDSPLRSDVVCWKLVFRLAQGFITCLRGFPALRQLSLDQGAILRKDPGVFVDLIAECLELESLTIFAI